MYAHTHSLSKRQNNICKTFHPQSHKRLKSQLFKNKYKEPQKITKQSAFLYVAEKQSGIWRNALEDVRQQTVGHSRSVALPVLAVLAATAVLVTNAAVHQ